ncbi:MAG: PAS domain S-box protein [Chlorobiales bacterium]|nr:PAS domain S-box protein [Chlorobiales bacterium]
MHNFYSNNLKSSLGRLNARRIAGIYALVGILWIFSSDWVLFHLIGTTDDMMFGAIAKGLLYIAITAYLVYRLVRALSQGLEQSEARYRTIVENQTEFIIRWKSDMTLTFVNPAYCKYFGIDPEHTNNAHIFDILRPEDQKIIKERLNLLTPDTPAITSTHCILRPDGSIAWSEWTDRGTFDKTGKLVEIQSVGRDVTAREIATEKLRVSEELFRHTFEENASGMAHHSLDGYFVRMNPKFCKILGYTASELLKKNFKEITHPDDLDDNLENIQKLLNGEIQHYQTEKRYIRKDGSVVWANVGVSLLRDPSGKPISFIASIENISAQKSMLARIEHLNAMLAAVRDVNQLITKEADPQSLVRDACQILVSVPTFTCARIALLDEQGTLSDLVHAGEDDSRLISVLEDCFAKAKLNHPAFAQEVQNDPAVFVGNDACAPDFLRHRYKDDSFVMTSTLQFEARLFGVLAVATEKNYPYAEEDASLFQEVAGDIGFALNKIEMQRALAESEEKFRVFTAATYDWEDWLGPDNQFIYISPSCERITGYSAEAFYKDPLLMEKILHPDDKENFLRHRKELIESKARTCEGTFRVVRANGEVRWIGHVCQAVISKNGDYLGRRGSNRDITAEILAQEALQASQRRYQNLFDAISDAIFLHEMNPDGPGKFIDVNEEACQRLHYTKEEFLSLTPLDIVSPESQKIVPETANKLWQTGRATFNSKHISKDGTVIPVESSVHLFKWDGRDVVLSVSRDITGRIEAEDQLRQRKELLEKILETIPVMVASFDKENNLVWVNRQWVQTLGWTLEEARNTDIFQKLYPDPEYREHVIQRISNAESTWEDFKTRRRDGQILDTTWAIVPLSDGASIGIGLDITERIRAEEALRQSQERLKLALIGGNLGLWDWNIETDFVGMNERWAAMLGHRLDEIPPHLDSWKSRIHPEDFQTVMEALNAHLRGETDLYESEHRMRTKSDDWIWVLDRGKVVEWDANGKPKRAAGTHLDITARKKAEQNLVLFYTAIEQLPDIVIITNPLGVMEYVNPAFERITGYTREEALGKTPQFLSSPAENNRYSNAAIMNLVRTGDSWSGRFVNRAKDGRLFYQDTTMAPVLGPNNTPLAYVGVGRDVTIEVKREASTRQSQKLEAIGSLAGGIAHDFNNILQGILGYTQLVYDGLEPNKKERRFLNEVLNAVDRAAGLIKQILTFSRQAEQEPRPLLLHVIVKEALKLMRGTIPSNIQILDDIDRHCGPILADPVQMHQVIMNLCTNAWHAMRETGGTMTISLSEVEVNNTTTYGLGRVKPGKAVMLSVQDTGYGMDEDTLQRIFEPYFTTKEKTGGTGLGLATVHGIVINHNGAISVQSAPGKGTIFQIYLPVIDSIVSDTCENRETHTSFRGNGEILFVDDEEALLRICEQALTDMGFYVTTAKTGEEAFHIFKSDPDKFDIVLTDMTMPGWLGTQLSAQVKTIRPNMPVLLLTGFSDLLDEEMQKACGISKVMMKPVGLFDLANNIMNLIGKD